MAAGAGSNWTRLGPDKLLVDKRGAAIIVHTALAAEFMGANTTHGNGYARGREPRFAATGVSYDKISGWGKKLKATKHPEASLNCTEN